MRVLVTGADGFVGRHVCRVLREAGHGVVGWDRTDGPHHDVVASPEPFWWALRETDAVVHLAALTSIARSRVAPVSYVRTNVEATARIAEALADQAPKTVVFASSCAVYGESWGRCPECGLAPARREGWALRCEHCGRAPVAPAPMREDQPLRPSSLYGATKLAGELALAPLRDRGHRVVCARFFNVVGPGMNGDNGYAAGPIKFLQAAAGGDAPMLYEDGLQTRDYVHVCDVADFVAFALADGRADGPVNVGTGVATSAAELAALAYAVLGRLLPAATRPEGTARAGEVRHAAADPGRAAWLGWRATRNLRQALTDAATRSLAPAAAAA
jgi:dTDP-L-rhamnose 4-epimerase